MSKNAATGARIAWIRTQLDESQPEFGARFGISKQSVSAWEKGKSIPKRPTLAKIADLAGKTVDWLLSGRDKEPSRSAIPYIGKGRLIPKMGKTERSKAPARHHLHDRPEDAPEMVQTHFPCGAAAFALQVVGVSMEPEFRDGDIIVIDPDIAPEPGDFVWVELKDEPYQLFRRYRPKTFCKGRPSTVELVPLNKDWPTAMINLKTQGKIVGVLVESAKQWAKRSRSA